MITLDGGTGDVYLGAIPTLEPSCTGLTNAGNPKSSETSASARSSSTTTNCGVEIPMAAHISLQRCLSMARAEPSTPLPVYGNPNSSRAP